MQATDVYRFVGLRPVAPRSPRELSDPFMPAYGDAGEPGEGSVRQRLAAAFEAGDLAELRSLADAIVASDTADGAWYLVDGTRYAAPFAVLPDLVLRGDLQAAKAAVVEAFTDLEGGGVGTHGRPTAIEDLSAAREAVADYFAASAVLGGHAGDLDGAAHLICCFETVARVIAILGDADDGADDEPLAGVQWQLPLTAGTVVLPYVFAATDTEREEPGPVPERSPDLLLRGGRPIRGRGPRHFVGDLILLKQQLRRYELGEIAHVENILAKEHLDRTFRTLRRTESRLLAVEDTEKEVIRDQQSTTRDELSTEIDSAMSEQLDLSANFSVTATYLGPSVTVTGSVGGSAGYRRSTEERTSTATAHAQEVVSRASERIRQRTLTQRERIETSETEDTTTHGFINDAADSIVGVYRWLEKTFDLHLVNYGRRLIYEFIVPEPASYWAALVAERGNGQSGPKPPPPTLQEADKPLTVDDLSLGDAVPLEVPARWADIVTLAGEWGVTLTEPPTTTAQVHFALAAPGETNSDTEKAIISFGGADNFFYESGVVSSAQSQQPLTVPDGYAAHSGTAAMKGWMYVRKSGKTTHQFERGYAFLLFNGNIYSFSHGVDPMDTRGGVAKITFPDTDLFPPNTDVRGQVPVLLTTSLNGLSATIRLDCRRTTAKARQWADATFAAFAAAYAERLARWEDERTRAQVGNNDWADNLPSQKAREIERRELKRGILTDITGGALDDLGTAVLNEGDNEPLPPVPAVIPANLPAYTAIVRFFEQVFDWANLGYVFSAYYYGRRSQWTRLALAENADAQFAAFLSAGVARVQVPVRLGYEAHAKYFFQRIGLPSLDARIPWLGSMRAIAEDLAADAREGFQPGIGRVSVANGGAVVNGTATAFANPQDVDREIRLTGQIYIIRAVRSATEVQISPPYTGASLVSASYELGGIVVGAPFPLKLPTTLVAIDEPGLTLPSFPARYAGG